MASFRAATSIGLASPEPDADTLPPTYPLLWLNEGAVRDAILAELLPSKASETTLPLHVEQSFDIPEVLSPDTRYWMVVSLTDVDARQMVQIIAQIADEKDNPLGQMMCTLLLIDPQNGTAA